MPTKPPTHRPVTAETKQQQRQRHDKDRAASRISRIWYSSGRWQRKRAQQLQAAPLCRLCELEGKIRAASIADHINPHHDDHDSFWYGPLQSLCKPHHDSDKQREERAAARKEEAKTSQA